MLTTIILLVVRMIQKLRALARLRAMPAQESPIVEARDWTTRRCLQCGVENYLEHPTQAELAEMKRLGQRFGCWSCSGELSADQPRARRLKHAVVVDAEVEP